MPEIGLTDIYSVPPRTFQGSGDKPTARSGWIKRVVRHVSCVLQGRDVDLIIKALERNKQLEAVISQPFVQKAVATGVVKKIQEHWTPRLSVHLWDRLSLSRSECETLRHLLSFRYLPKPTDKFVPLFVWVNPDDPDECVEFPILPGRHSRQKEFRELVDAGQISVGSRGNCQRDARVAVAELYEAYAGAMRTNYTEHRPALPVFSFDGTGQSLGKGLCHAELGSADFVGDTKQSRKTLQPLAASEGSDHAIPIRESMEYATSSYNKLISARRIELVDGTHIPARPIATGDMQAVKALVATSEQTHAVWCKCLNSTGRQHKYSKIPISWTAGNARSIAAAYDKMLQYIERSADGPQCKMKTFDEQCCFNHVCPSSVARGGEFSPFTCTECEYCPTKEQYTKDISDFEMLTPKEQAARRKIHIENGKVEHEWNRHYFGNLYMSPMLYLDFART